MSAATETIANRQTGNSLLGYLALERLAQRAGWSVFGAP